MKKALLSLFLVAAFLPMVMAQRTIVPESVTACQSYTWAVNGQTYTNDTVVTYTTNDTVYVLSLNINTPFVSNETINSEMCTYNWRGQNIVLSGTYSDTIVAVAGSGMCDSVFNANIHVSNTETVNHTANACGSYTWFDSTYTTSGVYTHTVNTPVEGSMFGCTHIDQLNLNITSTIYVNEQVSHCGDYTWFGEARTQTGVYTHTVTDSVIGCDTIHNLNLTIVVDTAAMVSDSACAEKTWRGNRYTVTGIYSMLDTNSSTHCVTYRSVNMKIKQPRTPELDTAITGCNSINYIINSFAGSTTKKFNESTLFDTTIIDHRWARCYDSTIHLNVTVNKSGYDTTYANACDSFYWSLNKKIYYHTPETNPSTAFATDSFGCDSMMTLILTVNAAPVISAINGEWNLNAGDTAVLAPTCTPGASYLWHYGNQTSRDSVLIIPNVTGNMDVTLEATINYPANNIACHDTSWITLVTFVGINGAENTNISLYPNPSVGQLNIESAEAINEVVIFNALGQQVAVNYNLGTKSLMNLSNLSKGTYSMRVKLQNGETIIRKFVITK